MIRQVRNNPQLLVVFAIVVPHLSAVLVTIPDGVLNGSIFKDYAGELFYGFRKIPYAKPPIGELRFKVSEKNNPWHSVLDATSAMPICIQPDHEEIKLIGLEDCLYLNVFTPSLNTEFLKPVMIYIHGGKFTQGTGEIFEAGFLMTQDIVLVTINYRLGVYGFINTINSPLAKEDEMIGNNGFKDQILAMKWVQNNIKYFGGNPDLVTICGESAGGMAVHGHLQSALSVGLYHRAIAMSGTSIMVMIPTKNNTATLIAENLGLNTTDLTVMMNVLRHASHEDLFKAAKELKWFQIQLNQPCWTCMVVEKPNANSFISHYPIQLIKSGNYTKIPLLLGTTNREGLLLHAMSHSQTNIKQLETHIPFFFNNKKEALKKIKLFYNLTSDINDNTIDFYTDIWFKYNTFRTAREQAKVQTEDNIFYYEFSGDGRMNMLKSLLPGASDFHGACHADELGYLFNCSGSPDKGSMEEKLMFTMVKIWADFVKTGRPLPDLKPFSVDVYNYVNITNEGLKIGVLNEKSFNFWDNMYDEYSDGLY